MSYEIFFEQIQEASASYPSLVIEEREGRKILVGSLDLVDGTGKLWDTYQIEIHYRDKFPARYPVLFETGGRIPKLGDWHVFEDTHACCVSGLPTELIRCAKGITVSAYISEAVFPYLFNQTHRMLEGYYVNGDYSHGWVGTLECFNELLATAGNWRKLLQLFHFIVTHARPGRTSVCFCGSGNKFRKCHRTSFDQLKRVDETILNNEFVQLSTHLNPTARLFPRHKQHSTWLVPSPLLSGKRLEEIKRLMTP